MNGQLGLVLAALTLVCVDGALAAEPAAPNGPAVRAVSTPAGPMLELTVSAPQVAKASVQPTDVVATPAGPMLVLRDPMAAARSVASSARSLAASPTSALPTGARAEALPNGAQVLVVPATEVPVAPDAAPAVVEIDPAKPGTRAGDLPRNDVLYRPKVVVPAAKR